MKTDEAKNNFLAQQNKNKYLVLNEKSPRTENKKRSSKGSNGMVKDNSQKALSA